jgi:hypothetical protein
MNPKEYYNQLRKQGKKDAEAIKLSAKKFNLKKSELEMILNI